MISQRIHDEMDRISEEKFAYKVWIAFVYHTRHNGLKCMKDRQTIPSNISFVRTDVGTYRIKSNGLFLADKTKFAITNEFETNNNRGLTASTTINRIDENNIEVKVTDPSNGEPGPPVDYRLIGMIKVSIWQEANTNFLL